MTCPACTTAAERPAHEFRAACRGCCARAISRSPQAFAARKAGQQTRAYRDVLRQLGEMHMPSVTHAEVIAAFDADAINVERAE